MQKGDVSADVVIKAFMQKTGNKLDGDGIYMNLYTLKGKRKRPALDPAILNSLMVTAHSKHPFSLLSLTKLSVHWWNSRSCRF